MRLLCLTLVAAALALPAAAQTIPQLLPFARTDFVYVPDPGSDQVFRLVDLDLDGDFNGPGEVGVFYSDTLGAFPLTNCNGITVDAFGRVFVGDSSEGNIYRMVDLDGDGSCHDAGETVVWFDGNGGAASGVQLASPANLTVDQLGAVWVASSGDGANPVDNVVRLFDANFDGDANDLGEALVYYVPAPGGAGGDSLPQDVTVGFDGRLYMLDIPSSTGFTKGVYRLSDDDFSGVIDQPGEATLFFQPLALAANPFYWGLCLDANGYFYMADTLNELIWRFRDNNNDGTVDPLTEANIYYQGAGASLIWRLAAAGDGSLLAAESENPDRILRLKDTNNDGVVDPVTETTVLWSDALGAPDIVNPRSIAVGRPPTVLSNPTPSIGTPLSIGVFGTVGDTIQLYYSGALISPLPLPPFGFLELNPAASFGLLTIGSVGAFSPVSLNLNISNNPALIGQSVHLQALGGQPTLLRIGGAFSLTFQP
jgi:sugar lactone lactonase YvrE